MAGLAVPGAGFEPMPPHSGGEACSGRRSATAAHPHGLCGQTRWQRTRVYQFRHPGTMGFAGGFRRAATRRAQVLAPAASNMCLGAVGAVTGFDAGRGHSSASSPRNCIAGVRKAGARAYKAEGPGQIARAPQPTLASAVTLRRGTAGSHCRSHEPNDLGGAGPRPGGLRLREGGPMADRRRRPAGIKVVNVDRLSLQRNDGRGPRTSPVVDPHVNDTFAREMTHRGLDSTHRRHVYPAASWSIRTVVTSATAFGQPSDEACAGNGLLPGRSIRGRRPPFACRHPNPCRRTEQHSS